MKIVIPNKDIYKEIGKDIYDKIEKKRKNLQ